MKVRDMALCALFAALTAVCAWISIPVPEIAFTLQTFAVFLTLGILGGKLGTVTSLVYLLLGAVGLPVFTGFRGGIGVLLGVTGGYIWGFLASGLVYWAVTAIFGKKSIIQVLAMVLGQLACYLCGTAWYTFGYLDGTQMGFMAAFIQCVVPYLLPDAIKLGLAFLLTRRLQRYVNHTY